MPSAISRAVKHRFPRRKNGVNRPVPTVPIGIVSATKATTTITVVFNQPVGLKGVPAYTTNISGVTVLSATLSSPTTLVLTFSASVATATSLIIPFEEPAIRNASGGYANPGTFPVS
jgi:hypothetical protein